MPLSDPRRQELLPDLLHEARDAGQPLPLVFPVAQVDELLVGTQTQRAGVFLDQFDEADGIGEAVAAQGHDRALGPRLDAFDAGLTAIALDRDDRTVLGSQLEEVTEQ